MDWEKYWCQRNENPLLDAETLKFGKGGTIREIGQVPLSINDIEGQYMGLLKFSQSGVELLRESFRRYKKMGLIMNKVPEMAYMTDLLMQLIKDGIKIQSVPVRLPWVEVDTKEDLVSSYTLERISLIEKKLSFNWGRKLMIKILHPFLQYSNKAIHNPIQIFLYAIAYPIALI